MCLSLNVDSQRSPVATKPLSTTREWSARPVQPKEVVEKSTTTNWFSDRIVRAIHSLRSNNSVHCLLLSSWNYSTKNANPPRSKRTCRENVDRLGLGAIHVCLGYIHERPEGAQTSRGIAGVLGERNVSPVLKGWPELKPASFGKCFYGR